MHCPSEHTYIFTMLFESVMELGWFDLSLKTNGSVLSSSKTLIHSLTCYNFRFGSPRFQKTGTDPVSN
jgi:hypothetical protein